MEKYNSFKKQVWEILDPTEENCKLERYINYFIISLISLNILAMIFETCKSLYQPYSHLFYDFEVFSVVVFTVEYLLRVWSITSSPEYSHPIKGRIRYIFSFISVVDLVSILPFYLPFLGVDLRFMRVARLTRLLRIIKIGRYSSVLDTMRTIIRKKREELIISTAILFLVLIFASSVLYYVENQAQPDKFTSIPHAMWWGIATLTTIGYGDIFPITVLGKLIASFISVLSIGICALPTGIISAGFLEEMQNKKLIKICPHCGEEVVAWKEKDTGFLHS